MSHDEKKSKGKKHSDEADDRSDKLAERRQLAEEISERCRATPGKKFRLEDCDPAFAGNPQVSKADRKELAEKSLSQDVSELASMQELLYAANTWSVLVIFQAMDAAGKDSTIRHVMSGINPQGCQVYSFKQPSSEELDHDFLWRCNKALPERGRIGIFNRSYYEEVLVVRVHPEYLANQRIPANAVPQADAKKDFWHARYEDINNFERHLTRNGTAIVKFFLNVSHEEQRQRFLERIDNSEKHWKFSAADVSERAHWDEYMRAYEAMISATSTDWAPWYVLPADHKWVTRAIAANVLTRTIRKLDLSYPETSSAQEERIEQARKQLESEGK
jgi:PPK2 family polyphosphate:nucleotide phosphotransferase